MAQSAAAPDQGAAARQALDMFLSQKYPDLRQMFAPELARNLSEAQLKSLGGQIQPLGAAKVGDPEIHPAGGNRIVVFSVAFPTATMAFQLTVNSGGQIANFFMRRTSSAPATPWERPAYSKPDSFRERDVTIGGDEWKLPGTLTVPVGNGPFPAVLLVHGSGPNDRDETVGPNKVFKDLAEGLASRGVVVLRYEKRTRQYSSKTEAMDKFTVKEETVDDALRGRRRLARASRRWTPAAFSCWATAWAAFWPRASRRRMASWPD